MAAFSGGVAPHLDRVHRAGGEGGVRERLGGAQQVADAVVVVLVLLDGLDAHAVFGQQGLVARGVARRRHELKVTVTTAQQETSPGVRGQAKQNAALMMIKILP